MFKARDVIIFGGTGFIGTHFAQFVLRENIAKKVILVDIRPPRDEPYTAELQRALRNGSAEYIHWDVTRPIPESLAPGTIDLVVNLAAIHREPGHMPWEYFATNLPGAENVCAFAASHGTRFLVFTSSISVYGPTEEAKTENSLTIPETPYGNSKLVAESIHRTWQAASPGRRLLILRPGVIFGPGEGGNVTRLVRSLVQGYFVYMGNRNTRKAGGYVKELCEVIRFGMEQQIESGEPSLLLNFSMSPTAPMEEFVDVILDVAKIHSKPLSVPRTLLLGASYLIDAIARMMRIQQPISPTRVRKLFRSTNIEAARLSALGYTYRYTLKSAFEDWMHELPADFEKPRQQVLKVAPTVHHGARERMRLS